MEGNKILRSQAIRIFLKEKESGIQLFEFIKNKFKAETIELYEKLIIINKPELFLSNNGSSFFKVIESYQNEIEINLILNFTISDDMGGIRLPKWINNLIIQTNCSVDISYIVID